MGADRILTTHVGSLARPAALLDLMSVRLRRGPDGRTDRTDRKTDKTDRPNDNEPDGRTDRTDSPNDNEPHDRTDNDIHRPTDNVPRNQADSRRGPAPADEPFDEDRYQALVRSAVDACVRMQAECGIDIVGDGEMSKPGFYTYVRSRLDGFEPRPDEVMPFFEAEVAAFPEYYERYFAEAMTGGAVAPVVPLVCTGPVGYRGLDLARTDIDNLRTSAAEVAHVDVFMPAVAPSGLGRNEYYATEEEYFHAAGQALAVEYRAIVDAGLILQVDDPFLTDIFVDPALDSSGRRRRAAIYVEAVNEALRGIPSDRVRWHTCYGINEGPRIHEAALAEVVPYMLQVNAGGYSFEAANPRHEHEYHLWKTLSLPDDKVLIPGVITHASNIVEHPEYIAERIVRFARLVGRDRVIAGADCGFSSQASYRTEVHPTVIRAKLSALAQGARLATDQLW